MTLRASRVHGKSLAWWGRALLSSAAGLIVSLFVSLLVVAGIRADMSPFIALDRMGGDLGARLLWVGRIDEDIRPGYIFVDVDEQACVALPSDDPRDCKSGKPVSAALVAQFVRDTRDQGARIVIIDVSPFESPEEISILRAALIAPGGSWIIAPVAGRPIGQSGALRGSASAELAAGGVEGRLRLASFVALTDPRAGDGLVRLYATSTPYYTDEGTRRIVPSAPALAALLLTPGGEGIADCLFYRRCTRLRAANRDTPAARIVYSLPSLAMLDPDNPEFDEAARSRAIRIETRFADRGYSRLVASKLLKAGRGRFAFSGQAAGKVVVLGSSLPNAMDMHATPLGPMAGSELVINATRAFERRQIFRVNDGEAPPSSWATELRTKATAAFRGALVMLPFWMGIHWLLRRRKGRRRRSLIALTSVRTGAAALFVAGLCLSVFVELRDAADALRTSMAEGRTVDVLTPILLLGLDGYAEAVKAFVALLERWLLGTFRGVRDTVASLSAKMSAMIRQARMGDPDVEGEGE